MSLRGLYSDLSESGLNFEDVYGDDAGYTIFKGFPHKTYYQRPIENPTQNKEPSTNKKTPPKKRNVPEIKEYDDIFEGMYQREKLKKALKMLTIGEGVRKTARELNMSKCTIGKLKERILIYLKNQGVTDLYCQ